MLPWIIPWFWKSLRLDHKSGLLDQQYIFFRRPAGSKQVLYAPHSGDVWSFFADPMDPTGPFGSKPKTGPNGSNGKVNTPNLKYQNHSLIQLSDAAWGTFKPCDDPRYPLEDTSWENSKLNGWWLSATNPACGDLPGACGIRTQPSLQVMQNRQLHPECRERHLP
jgi:hypothetical protein